MAQSPPDGSVEGRVINSFTGGGIPEAVVILVNGPTRYRAVSDLSGNFRMTSVAPGNYRAAAEKDGFSSTPPELPMILNSGIRVTAGADPIRIELKLAALTTLRGRVLDPDGKPVAGIEVNLNPNLLGGEVTDSEGRFAMEAVRPGSYTLSARPPGNAKPIQAADGSKTAMITTYYPSVADKTLAQPIVFRGEGDLDRYEIQMQTAPVHRVRGIVLDEDGKPASNAELALMRASDATSDVLGLSIRPGGSTTFAVGVNRAPCCTPEATVFSGQDGRFEFPAAPSGDWRINAESDPLHEEQGRAVSKATIAASVGRGDVDDLEIRLAKPFRQTGTLEWASDEPERGAALVTVLNADHNEFAANGVAHSGQLTFENLLPGRYKVLVRPGLSGQILLGENDVTGQVFSLAAGGPPLRVVAKPWSGTVRGTVEKGDGATVVLLPETGGQIGFGQTIPCGPSGSFELNEVSPGDYYIAAFDRPVGMYPSPEILTLLPSRGTRVKVEERSASSVTLSVISTAR